MADDETNVVNIMQPEPQILFWAECDGVSFHVYDDKSMVCANKDCGVKTRFELSEGSE